MLKYHKESLKKLKCILINLTKSEIGIISKEYIDSVNRIITEKNVKQWRNTDVVSDSKYL